MTAEEQLRMYDALRRIALAYHSAERIRKTPELWRGLSCEQALTCIMTDMQTEAREAIKGVRRPNEIETA